MKMLLQDVSAKVRETVFWKSVIGRCYMKLWMVMGLQL